MTRNKILIVNDEPSTTQLLQMLLGVQGYDVATVKSGREALQKAHGDSDLVLLNRNLPDYDGNKICNLLKINTLILLVLHQLYMIYDWLKCFRFQ